MYLAPKIFVKLKKTLIKKQCVILLWTINWFQKKTFALKHNQHTKCKIHLFWLKHKDKIINKFKNCQAMTKNANTSSRNNI